ncbi:MAG: hypothetical protein H7228_09360 [Polaromonas sp.]|nr:hypothetical protein [Polaromonas sp.]
MLFAEGYDDAILGVVEIHGVLVVAYDAHQVVRTLRTRHAMSLEDAEEFFAYNIAGSYIGECSPVFVQRIPLHKAK